MRTYTALLTFSSDSADDAQSTIRQLRDGIESSDAYPVIREGWTFTGPHTDDDLGPDQPAHALVQRLYDQAGDADSAILDRILVEAGYFAVCPICRWQDFAEGFQCGDCGRAREPRRMSVRRPTPAY